MNIFSVDKKVDVSWHPQVASVWERWQDYDLDVESFRKAVFVKGINHAKGSYAKAWIFDPGTATGEFSPEIQDMIASDRFPALAWTGVKYFIRIDSEASTTELTGNPENTRGIQCVISPSAEAAMAWLATQ